MTNDTLSLNAQNPALHLRQVGVYEGNGQVVSTQPPITARSPDETRYTPSQPSAAVTYELKVKQQKAINQDQSLPRPAAGQPLNALVYEPTTTHSSRTPAMEHHAQTLEHDEPAALKVFREISNNSESRKEKFQRVNLFA